VVKPNNTIALIISLCDVLGVLLESGASVYIELSEVGQYYLTPNRKYYQRALKDISTVEMVLEEMEAASIVEMMVEEIGRDNRGDVEQNKCAEG
jgi:hypothetical protein